ncbi:MAG: hypothetical protein HY293_14860 [Planctomycetes bacterium]|nr:hypothetical protein [Planctomycetota bacterium]
MLKLPTIVLLALSPFQEQVENPQYKMWAACKPESWVKHKMEIDQGDRTMTMETTLTLLEVTTEKIVLERKSKMDVGGRLVELPAKREEVPPKIEKGKAASKPTEKEEEIKVAGKTLKCRVWETEMDSPNGKMQGKSWINFDVPGGVVQGEFNSDKLPKPMKMTATGWEKK